MNKTSILLLLCMCITTLTYAQKNPGNTDTWTGTYRGILPCADCAGVVTELTLSADQNCVINRLYLNAQPKTISKKGKIKWNDDRTEIYVQIEGEPDLYNRFHVTSEGLQKLDRNGQNIYTNLTNSYMLSKVKSDGEIASIYWVLDQIRGKAVDPKSKELPFFILFNDGEIVGNNGCNSFVGMQKHSPEGEFRVSIVSTSLKACSEAKWETQFMNVLDRAEMYKVEDGKLQLLQEGGEPFAVFRRVDFE